MYVYIYIYIYIFNLSLLGCGRGTPRWRTGANPDARHLRTRPRISVPTGPRAQRSMFASSVRQRSHVHIMCVHIHMYIYIYIYIEREREFMCTHINVGTEGSAPASHLPLGL